MANFRTRNSTSLGKTANSMKFKGNKGFISLKRAFIIELYYSLRVSFSEQWESGDHTLCLGSPFCTLKLTGNTLITPEFHFRQAWQNRKTVGNFKQSPC